MKIEKGMIVTFATGGTGLMECTAPANHLGMVMVKSWDDQGLKSEWSHEERELREVLPAEMELRRRFQHYKDTLYLSERALDAQDWRRMRDCMRACAIDLQHCITDTVYLANYCLTPIKVGRIP